jgi:hypothetical protein
MLRLSIKPGHKAQDCKENRVFDLKDVPSKSPEEAWIMIQVASQARNLEEFRTVSFPYLDLAV